jgi:hypothetical protein
MILNEMDCGGKRSGPVPKYSTFSAFARELKKAMKICFQNYWSLGIL